MTLRVYVQDVFRSVTCQAMTLEIPSKRRGGSTGHKQTSIGSGPFLCRDACRTYDEISMYHVLAPNARHHCSGARSIAKRRNKIPSDIFFMIQSDHMASVVSPGTRNNTTNGVTVSDRANLIAPPPSHTPGTSSLQQAQRVSCRGACGCNNLPQSRVPT